MKDAFSHIRTTGFIALNQLCELTLLITQHNQCQGLKDTDAYTLNIVNHKDITCRAPLTTNGTCEATETLTSLTAHGAK